MKHKKRLFNKVFCLGLVSLLILAGAITIINSNVYALANAQNTYTNIYMPASGLTNVSHEVTINNVPNLGSASYFWSDSIYFTGAPSNGSAYFGIQGINRAVFSVFDWPSTEYSSDCTVSQSGFDGGVYSYGGTSCILNYTVTQGDTYLLSVTDIGQDSQGINWQATVKDTNTGITTDIATINIPSSWGTLTNTQDAWTEYFGSAPSSCSALPYSNVTFSDFTANSGQYSGPSSHTDTLQTGTGCSGYSQIIDSCSNSFNQIMGINPPVSNTIVSCSPTAAPTISKSSSTHTTIEHNTSSPAAVARDTTPPTTPINLIASAISNSKVNLNWSASTDNISVAGYYVYRSTGRGSAAKVATVTNTSYSDSGLSNSTQYNYYIEAFDSAGNISPPSSTASTTTQAPTPPITQLAQLINNTEPIQSRDSVSIVDKIASPFKHIWSELDGWTRKL